MIKHNSILKIIVIFAIALLVVSFAASDVPDGKSSVANTGPPVSESLGAVSTGMITLSDTATAFSAITADGVLPGGMSYFSTGPPVGTISNAISDGSLVPFLDSAIAPASLLGIGIADGISSQNNGFNAGILPNVASRLTTSELALAVTEFSANQSPALAPANIANGVSTRTNGFFAEVPAMLASLTNDMSLPAAIGLSALTLTGIVILKNRGPAIYTFARKKSHQISDKANEAHAYVRMLLRQQRRSGYPLLL